MKRLLMVLGVIMIAATAIASEETCKLNGISVPGFATKQIPTTQFQSLHAAVAPKGDTERWMEIPWQTDLKAARKLAEQEKKPLLMWVMDGHPLGCT